MSESKDIAVRGEQMPEKTRQGAVVAPPVDIFESNEEVLVVADVPGVDLPDVNLRFDKNQLFIEAATTRIEEGRTPLFREFGDVTYQRAFELAPGIDVERITADLKLGVLRIHLPKAAALKPRKIAITQG
jgi:HSP20 family molecular chaperone IbpA